MPDEKDKKTLEDRINRLLHEKTSHQGAIIKGQIPDFRFSAPVPEKPTKKEATDDESKPKKNWDIR